MFPLIHGPLSPLGGQIREWIVLLDFLAAGGVSFGVDLAGVADAMAKWWCAANRTGTLVNSGKVEHLRINLHGTSSKDGSGSAIFASRSLITCSQVLGGAIFAGNGRVE